MRSFQTLRIGQSDIWNGLQLEKREKCEVEGSGVGISGLMRRETNEKRSRVQLCGVSCSPSLPSLFSFPGSVLEGGIMVHGF